MKKNPDKWDILLIMLLGVAGLMGAILVITGVIMMFPGV